MSLGGPSSGKAAADILILGLPGPKPPSEARQKGSCGPPAPLWEDLQNKVQMLCTMTSLKNGAQ